MMYRKCKVNKQAPPIPRFCQASYWKASRERAPPILKIIYSEKTTFFCEISTVDLSFVVMVKSSVEISQNFVAFSEYMNFNPHYRNFFEKQRKSRRNKLLSQNIIPGDMKKTKFTAFPVERYWNFIYLWRNILFFLSNSVFSYHLFSYPLSYCSPQLLQIHLERTKLERTFCPCLYCVDSLEPERLLC